MDSESLGLIRKVWAHAGYSGNVWTPQIRNIGQKGKERFSEGPLHRTTGLDLPDFNNDVDWYWTPAVARGSSRHAKSYREQRVVWVDCDESYDLNMLEALRPTFMWETSPGHRQAIWLMKEPIAVSEFHRDGLLGVLAQALGADKSGVDVSQLLRVPGTWHHKAKPYQGRVLRRTSAQYSRGQLLARVAKALGFSPALASELGADDPYGDRSKVLWRFARNAAELGLPQDLTFKLIKATKWNKWKDDPDRLKEDIGRAYDREPQQATPKPKQPAATEEAEEVSAWDMARVEDFGSVIRKPLNWIVPDVIPEAACGLIVAPPKGGKTRVSIELALGVATGRKPLGLSVRRPQSVGFFSLEDGEYLFSSRMNHSLNHDAGRYQYHWDGHINTDLLWQPPKQMPLFNNFNQVDLSTDEDMQRLYETIVKYELKFVIIDTLSMAIGKAEISSSKDMYAILKPLKVIAKETKCSIMFIHHTRKRVFEKGESIQEMVLGSTALHAWSDFILNLAPPEEDSDFLRLAVQTKMGNDLHYLDEDLKIIKRPKGETDE